MEPHESASRAKRRACLTHVAFIRDRPDIQPLLPQVLIGNETTFPKSKTRDAGKRKAIRLKNMGEIYGKVVRYMEGAHVALQNESST